MAGRTDGQHSGGISNESRVMDLANLGEVSVLKVPIRPGHTEALLTWFKEAAAKEGLWDLLSEQDVILRVFVERGDECDYLYSVKQGPDLPKADQILVEATGPFIEDRHRAFSQALRSEQGVVLTHVADLAAPRNHVPRAHEEPVKEMKSGQDAWDTGWRHAYQPFSPPQAQNLHEVWSRIRDEEPVFYSEAMSAWVVSRYHDARAVLTDPRRFSSEGTKAAIGVPPPAAQAILDEGRSD